MAAYLIASRKATKNIEELNEYFSKVGDTLEPYDVQMRAANSRFFVLEGAPVEDLLLAEFPTIEEAQSWYNSPAYRDVRKHRQAGADYDLFLIEGK